MNGDQFEIPSVPPSAAPLESVSLNAEWWPYVLGACEALRDRTQWHVSQADWDAFFSYWIEELLAALSNSV